MKLYGVSPAYFISAFSDRFTAHDVSSSLPDLRALGYNAFQMEIFHPETLSEWVDDGSKRVGDAAHRSGLVVSQFVAHFLLHAFESIERIHSAWGIEECGRVVEMLNEIEAAPVITVPLPAITGETSEPYIDLWKAVIYKLTEMARIVRASDRRLGLEIMPGAVISGTDGFLRIQSALAAQGFDIGYNFDTGHAWAQREPLWLIPDKVGRAMTGTHICDNDGRINDSLCPGKGTIPWESVMNAITSSGYDGPIDVEIKCSPDAVTGEYATALSYMKNFEDDRQWRDDR